MKRKVSNRGFVLFEFNDHYDSLCSLQESSLASEPAIWLGVANANPKIMASQAAAHGVGTDETTGWVAYKIPEAVLLTTRMHLTQEQVAEMLPMLQHFVDTGYLPSADE